MNKRKGRQGDVRARPIWPIVCRGMSVWGATPEPKQHFLHYPFQPHPSQVCGNTFSGPWCAGVWVLGAPPLNPNSIFWHCPFHRHPSQLFQNTFYGPWCAEIWVFEAPPQNPKHFFCYGPFQTHLSQLFQNTFFWPMVCRGMGVWGATREPKQNISAMVHFKHTHPRYSKTPFLAHGV